MPQDIDFALPFPLRVSADLEGARVRNLHWVQQQGLVTSQAGLEWYVSWDMPRLAAYGFPYAQGPELDLAADVMGFFFVFDDQLDGPLSRRPEKVARICQKLIDIVHGAAPGPGVDPCSRAFAGLWQRSRQGAPAGWVARVAHEWEYYFAAQAHEAAGRLRGIPADMDTCLQVRRGIAGTALTISCGELAAHLDVPAAAFHSPQLRLMREIAVDVPLMCNDVYSLEKEEARGDMDNLVLVLEHTHQYTRPQAVEAARREVTTRIARFQHLADKVPALCAQFGLEPHQQATVERYAGVMTAWMSGYHAWQTETLRYTHTNQTLPPSGPGYFDNILDA
ncbi:terpene cyclase [Streptomyces sp. NPDC059454]|uniref:terpene synthase family protein n=1 Tax=Streptomyces sp. NPDC059454 TaxID=3346836 RepID=UPI0036CFE61F